MALQTKAMPRPAAPWDPVVRITHWAVALGVVVNGLLVKPGGTVHVWVGWALAGLLLVRVLWGFVGPRRARFASFPPDPRATLSHLADLLRGRTGDYPSHNPAGAMMAYALWALIVVTLVTGLMMTGGDSPVTVAEDKAAVAAGDWSVLVRDGDDQDDDGVAEVPGDVHEVAANLILVLALLHVAGVIIEGRVLGRNLVRPMILGRK
jgi:cytochrome b